MIITNLRAYVLQGYLYREDSLVNVTRLISLSLSDFSPSERNDVIVVGFSLSVYGLGSPEYADSVVSLRPGLEISR